MPEQRKAQEKKLKNYEKKKAKQIQSKRQYTMIKSVSFQGFRDGTTYTNQYM
jgi:hypothetical protein